MTSLIMPSRRRFLFLAPAIVAASSLMPGHSIAKLLVDQPKVREFAYIFEDPMSKALGGPLEGRMFWGYNITDGGRLIMQPEPIELTTAEVIHHFRNRAETTR